jgi:hypothetical protein
MHTKQLRSWMTWRLESGSCDYSRGQIHTNQLRSWMTWRLESGSSDYSRGQFTNQSRSWMTWQLESRSCRYWRGQFTTQLTSLMTWRLDNWDPLIEGSIHEPVEILKGVAARIEILWSLEGLNHKPVEILNDVAARIEMLGDYSRGQITNRSRSWMMWRLESRCCGYLRGQIMNQSRSWMMWWLESRCCDYSRGEFTSQSRSCMEAARNRDSEWRGGKNRDAIITRGVKSRTSRDPETRWLAPQLGPPPNNELANANSETAKPPFLRSSLVLFWACFSPISLALMSNFVWGRSSPGFDCTPHLETAVLLLLSELLSSSDLLDHCVFIVSVSAFVGSVQPYLCVWVCWRVERGWRRTGLVGWLVVRRSLK